MKTQLSPSTYGALISFIASVGFELADIKSRPIAWTLWSLTGILTVVAFYQHSPKFRSRFRSLLYILLGSLLMVAAFAYLQRANSIPHDRVVLGMVFIISAIVLFLSSTLASVEPKVNSDTETAKPKPDRPAITEAEVRRSVYTHVGAMFHKLLEERRVYFFMTVFNGLPERISFAEKAEGFILIDGKPLPTRPLFTVSPRKYPEDRQTGISLTQEFSEDSARDIHDRLNRGEKVSFNFNEVRIYFKADRQQYRLELPDGLVCQTGVHCSEMVSMSSTGKISVRYLKQLSDEGKWLLQQAEEGRTSNLTEQVTEWENRVGNYLKAFMGDNEKAHFLSDENIVEYGPVEAHPRAKRYLLDRIHTRVARLDHVIEGLN